MITRRRATSEASHPLVTIAKVKGALRLAALDDDALRQGLRKGMSLADARAILPSLDVCEEDPAGEADMLATLTHWCKLFTPLVAPDGTDGIVLDISGAAHLFGGEAAMLATITSRLENQGFSIRTALAGTPAAAWALARYGRHGHIVPPDVPAEALARLFAPLPLAALRIDATIIAELAQAGLRRIGDLLTRPRAPLAARFGANLHQRLDEIMGLHRAPISPRFDAPPYIAERRFADGITQRDHIETVLLALAQDLCGLLARHGEGARQLEISFFRVDGAVKFLPAGTSRPLREPDIMARLFHERLETIGEDGLDTGYGFDVIRLAALSAEPLAEEQASWAKDETEAGASDLIDRLGARFGLARITKLAVCDTHRPELAMRALPPAGQSTPQQKAPRRHAMAALALAPVEEATDTKALPGRPMRLLNRPEPIDTIAGVPDGPPLKFRWRRVMHQVAAIEGPERIAPEWWKNASWKSEQVTRDYFRAEDTQGQRFWLFREGLYQDAPDPRWYMHGLFA